MKDEGREPEKESSLSPKRVPEQQRGMLVREMIAGEKLPVPSLSGGRSEQYLKVSVSVPFILGSVGKWGEKEREGGENSRESLLISFAIHFFKSDQLARKVSLLSPSRSNLGEGKRESGRKRSEKKDACPL